MRIGVYFSPFDAALFPTGVGQHVVHMVEELARVKEVEAVLLANRNAYERAAPNLTPGMAGLPVEFIPGSERFMRGLLMATSLAPVDRWTGPVDWIYCPKEQPVPTRHARLAVTVHDVITFEQNVSELDGSRGFYSRARWNLLMARILGRAHLIAAVSEFTKQRLTHLFPLRAGQEVVVVGNGVSEVYFRSTGPLDAGVLERYGVANRPFVVAIGGLRTRKGADRLLRFARLAHERHSDVEVLVTGRLHDAEYLEVLRREDHQNLPVKLAGYVPEDDLAVLLSHSVALLFPSRYEGFGIPAIEAMAAGAPVVSSTAAALPEVVGDAGILVPEGDPAGMFDAVQQLMHANGARKEFVVAGRARAARFTWDRCLHRLLDAMATFE